MLLPRAIARARFILGRAVLASALSSSLLGGAACGSDSSAPAAAPEQRRGPTAPVAVGPPARPAAGPGGLSGGAAWGRGGGGGGGGGGGRPLGREALDRHRRERRLREGPQRPPSERHQQLLQEGQQLAQQMAAARGMSEERRLSLARPPEAGQEDAWVRERCDTLLELNQQELSEQGVRGATGQTFLAQCRRNPPETFLCMDRGQEGRDDPRCRQHLGVIDRQVTELRRDAREVAHPARRIDSLATERWATEREEIAPEALGPDEVRRTAHGAGATSGETETAP